MNAEAKVSLEQLKGEVGYLATAITNSKRRNSKSASSSPGELTTYRRPLLQGMVAHSKMNPGLSVQLVVLAPHRTCGTPLVQSAKGCPAGRFSALTPPQVPRQASACRTLPGQSERAATTRTCRLRLRSQQPVASYCPPPRQRTSR